MRWLVMVFDNVQFLLWLLGDILLNFTDATPKIWCCEQEQGLALKT